MDEFYYPGLYLSQGIPQNTHLTIVDVAIVFFLGVFLVSSLTFVLNQWLKEQIKEMEEDFRLLEFQLLNRNMTLD
ncbi:hypothetical protein [Pedobacter sp. KBW01]|uniref:hypothetical protein n=1 Tax=Pedobacter sp. KBW01 TaxID=2153364 RepID=UPI000F5ACC33|nr:hypothetical protein [Pedobacter sp. KBW01]